MRLTMNLYTDPRIFDLKAAIEKMPPITATTPESRRQAATGTDAAFYLPDIARTGGSKGSKEVAQEVARIGLFGRCSVDIGSGDEDRRNKKLQDLSGKNANWHSYSPINIKAGDGIRTHDQQLGRL